MFHKLSGKTLFSLLLPLRIVLSGIFAVLSITRRWAYSRGYLASYTLPRPVVIVGNISAGGSGKTPVVIALAKKLQELGENPGIISRGYGGNLAREQTMLVKPGCGLVQICGDEAVLLAQRCSCPVVVGRNRVSAGQKLIQEYPECSVIISDDGLQHYSLQRDLELVIADQQLHPKAHLLPWGRLREPMSRLNSVDALLLRDESCQINLPQNTPLFKVEYCSDKFYLLQADAESAAAARNEISASELQSAYSQIHAMAGIAWPEKFFDTLRGLGFKQFVAYSFPDHHNYSTSDLEFSADALLITEKDAVKLRELLPLPYAVWVLPLHAQITPDLADWARQQIVGNNA